MKELPIKTKPFLLGLNLSSRLVGALAQNEWSPAVTKLMIRAFASAFGIDLASAERPWDQYETLDAFFTRRLRAELRRIESNLVHPCDGQLTRVQKIESGQLLQIKGVEYSVSELLGEDFEFSAEVSALTYYLSPKDCHRVFCPMDCSVERVRHIPGTLWPVNSWAVKNINGLFVKNERIVFSLRSSVFGRVFLVMVGALNVGQIEVSFDDRIWSNSGSRIGSIAYEYKNPIFRKVGEELGIFHLGSSVVLIFEKRIKGVAEGQVQYGWTIGEGVTSK